MKNEGKEIGELSLAVHRPKLSANISLAGKNNAHEVFLLTASSS